ncbi:hypothetical protein AB6F04_006980 [Vibrio cyclitrophicus]
MRVKLEFIILFLFSIYGYGDVTLVLSLLASFVYICLYRSRIGIYINSRSRKIIFILYMVIVFYTALSFFLPEHFLAAYFDRDILHFKIVGRLVLLLNIILIVAIFRKNSFNLAIKKLLLINVLLFYTQFFVYFIFGYNIDIIGFVTGEDQRNLYLGYYRPGGFYQEPSDYAMVVITLLLVRFFDGIGVNKLNLFAILSVALTFSTAAFLSIALLSIAFMLKFKLYNHKYFVLAFITIVVPVMTSAAIFQMKRFQNDDNLLESRAFEIRQQIVNYTFDRKIDDPNFYFGEGIYSYNLDKIVNNLTTDQMSSINDVGLGFTFIFRLGLVGVTFMLYLFLINRISTVNKIAMLSLLVMKFSLFSGLIYIPLVYSLVRSKNES